MLPKSQKKSEWPEQKRLWGTIGENVSRGVVNMKSCATPHDNIIKNLPSSDLDFVAENWDKKQIKKPGEFKLELNNSGGHARSWGRIRFYPIVFFDSVSSMKDGRWPKGWVGLERSNIVTTQFILTVSVHVQYVHNYADVSVQEIYSWSWVKIHQKVVNRDDRYITVASTKDPWLTAFSYDIGQGRFLQIVLKGRVLLMIWRSLGWRAGIIALEPSLNLSPNSEKVSGLPLTVYKNTRVKGPFTACLVN